MMARAAEIAVAGVATVDGEAAFYRAKTLTARYYAEAVIPRTASLKAAAIGSAFVLGDFAEESL